MKYRSLIAAVLLTAFSVPVRSAEDVGMESRFHELERRVQQLEAERSEKSAGSIGRYIPGAGFRVADTDSGSMAVKIFTYVRYLNQRGLEDTFTDSFGNTSTIQQREDILLNKVTLNFLGWFMDPKFRYLLYVWTSNTSQGQVSQVVVAGKLSYTVNEHLTFGGGTDSLPGVRTTEGNFPYWLGVDNRMLADEFFRPSYTMGLFANGTVVKDLEYSLMLGNNLSQLGIDAGQLDNKLATFSSALVWMPTTGEYGRRGEFGDFDAHKSVATRLGAHFTYSDENYQGQPTNDSFENVQIRLSDGNSIFKPGLFGSGIRVTDADYQMISFDGGIKHGGYALEVEQYWRLIDRFRGAGTQSLSSILDNGFQIQFSAMLAPESIQVYTSGSKVFGENGDPWDARLGLNWFPWKQQSMRWNFEFIQLYKSPVGGASLPYVVGGTGPLFHSNFMVSF